MRTSRWIPGCTRPALLALLGVCLLCCPCLLGCQGVNPLDSDEASPKSVERARAKPGMRGDGFPAPSRQIVWEAAARVMRDMQYAASSDESAPEAGIVVSRWRTSLSPFSRDGFREKATVRVLPVKGRSGYYRTESNVVRQSNNNIEDPGNAMRAKWGEPQRRPNAERLLNQRIEMFFLPSGVSDVFRRQHGMRDRNRNPRLEDLPQPEPEEGPLDWLR